MKSRPVRRGLPHGVPQWVPDGRQFFITINCETRGRNQLCLDGVGDALLASAQYQHEHGVWSCRVFLLMPDHLHGILAFPSEPGLKTTFVNWKKYIARTLGIAWQRDFFDHRLRDHHEADEKLSYILMNPVRRGLCARAEDWRWVYRPTAADR